jgi:N-acetyl-beta-hexosaminidase
MPEVYAWPNPDGLYCKSYCPLHPEVHRVVFALVDEILEVFEADAFHAGMDEVFYLGMEGCPRCGGLDRAELFAAEVTRIRDHLARRGVELWIWGDRLLDGKTTGIGMWEASMNTTHRAIDLIPGDVVINDWHYERADPTAAYFAVKGFRVVTCPWRLSDVALAQIEDMRRLRRVSTPEMRERFLGVMQTVWSDTGAFLDAYRGLVPPQPLEIGGDPVACSKAVLSEFAARGE